jgi:hypothetical protein
MSRIISNTLDKCVFGNRLSLYVRLLIWLIVAILLKNILSVFFEQISLYIFKQNIPDGLINIGRLFYAIIIIFFLKEKYDTYKKEAKNNQVECVEQEQKKY